MKLEKVLKLQQYSLNISLNWKQSSLWNNCPLERFNKKANNIPVYGFNI